VRFTLFGLAAIAIIGAIIVFVGPLLISTDDLRNSLFAQVESATGYRLRVSGPVQISLLPSLDLVAEDVGLAQGGGGAPAEMVRAKTLRFGLQLSALLGGKVKMTEITLINPVIAVPASGTGAGARGEGTAAADSAGSAVVALKSLSLDKLSIKNGTVILPAADGTPSQRIEAIDLEASLPGNAAPLAFDLKAILDGKRFAAAGSVDNFGHFLEGAAASISLTIDAPSCLDETATLTGTATYRSDSITLSQFTAKAGDEVLRGSASYKGKLLTLHPVTLTASGNTLSGSLVADLSGSVPAVNAAANGQSLNLDVLLSPTRTASAPSTTNASASWSDARIDFSGLRAVTAKLKLTANELLYNGTKFGSVTLQATVANGKLSATLAKFALYGGAGSVAVDIDASGKIPTQRVRLSLANFDAYPFLKDAAGFESIEGTGTISLDLAASGASQRAMVSALSGMAKLEFTDGAIRGINIAKTLRGLSSGILSGWQENAAEKTDFATLGASFTLAKGQAQTSNLRLAGPLVRMTGAGTVALPAQALKFRVDPKLVASLEGQGGKADLQGLGVPVMISGPWARPSIYPDIEGILSDPAAAYEQLSRLGGGLVSLPGAASTASVDAIGGLINSGQIGTDALGQGALNGIGQLLRPPQAAEPAMPPDNAEQSAPAEDGVSQAKKRKKRHADASAEPHAAPPPVQAPEAAKQVLQTLFGN
jgi:AsmA protein